MFVSLKFCGAPGFRENVLDSYRPQRNCEGYVFTGVCLSMGGYLVPGGLLLGGCLVPGGLVSQHALRQTPPGRDGYCCGRYASYTGMHSCFSCFYIEIAYSNFTFCGSYTLSFLGHHIISVKRAHPMFMNFLSLSIFSSLIGETWTVINKLRSDNKALLALELKYTVDI